MLVRPFEPEDEDTFLCLCKDFYNSGATIKPYNEETARKTFKYLMQSHENLWGYMMEDEESEAIVGYTLITSYWCNEEGGNIIILDELFIDQNDRHKGYAKLFLEWIQREFHNKAISLTLEVRATNVAAEDLYKKMGFVHDGFEVMTKNF